MPSLGLNLVSNSRLKSFYSVITPKKALIFEKERLITIGEQIQGLYYLNIRPQHKVLVAKDLTLKRKAINQGFQDPKRLKLEKRVNALEESLQETLKAFKALNSAKKTEKSDSTAKENKKMATLSLWHQRLGHINQGILKVLLKGLNYEEAPIGGLENHFQRCEPCLKAKFTNKVNKVSKNASKYYQYLEKVSSDICGPIKPQTYNGKRYFITFLDKATRYLEVKLLRNKSEAYESFTEFQNLTENNPKGYKIHIFASDNGGEFVNEKFTRLFKAKGITHQVSGLYKRAKRLS